MATIVNASSFDKRFCGAPPLNFERQGCNVSTPRVYAFMADSNFLSTKSLLPAVLKRVAV